MFDIYNLPYALHISNPSPIFPSLSLSLHYARNPLKESESAVSSTAGPGAQPTEPSREMAFYFAPDRGTKHCDQRICVSVCLFAWRTHTSNTTRPDFNKFSIECYLWPWLSFPLTKVQYNTSCTSGFVDDVIV